VQYDTWQSGVDVDLEVVREALETNLLGAWRTAQACLPLLRRSPHGRLVNVSSGAGSLGGMGAGAPAYSVSKAALNAMTRVSNRAQKRRRAGQRRVPGLGATDMGGAGGRPVEQGAASVMRAVTLADDGPTGGFLRDGRSLEW
jgi:NAD(P)-dependent dehydrogenase (short-subunit alcohol dehydrogenase family)